MKKKQIKTLQRICIFLLIIVFSFIILVPAITKYLRILEICFNSNYNLIEIKNIIDCFNSLGQNKIIGFICFIIDLILIFLCFNILFTNHRLKIENEGIDFKPKDGTHGTASFALPEDIEILKISNEKETNGLLLGKTLDTDEIITLPDSFKGVNRNIMVWGASGSR